MSIQINDREELQRMAKLCKTLDNASVNFPLTIYRGEGQTVAFMDGNSDRQFSVVTKGSRLAFTMSDRPGAREEWTQKEQEEIDRLLGPIDD